jgi:hypothetical protein
LNEPGLPNGVEEFWIDNQLDARRTDQNHISIFTQYGINQMVFDSFWNGGSPQDNVLYRDNFVVSTQRIGCLEEGIPTALVLDDGSDWTIDSNASAGEYVFTRNAGCGPGIDPCPNPGDPTTVYIEEGAVTGAAAVHDSSSLVASGGEIDGDLSVHGEGSIEISGGTVNDHLEANDASYVELTGGSVSGFLAASDDAIVVMSGGSVDDFIYAADNAIIEIVGADFAVDGALVPYGNLTAAVGTLTGTLDSGETVSNTFYQGDALGFYSGTIRLIPEPHALLNLVAGVGCLAALPRRRV